VDRLERLLNLVASLLDTERALKAEELKVRVPGYPEGEVAFHRAFNRDKATLRAMDIPLTTEWLDEGDPEAGQGYRIRRDRYELPDPGLEPEEVAALHFAATAVRLEGTEATEAIWKLGGVTPAAPAELREATASVPGGEHLAVLYAATTDRRTVTFSYRGDNREIEPWRLSFRNGFWYLVGWDRGRGDRRTFRVDRVTSAPELGKQAVIDRPRDAGRVSPQPWEMGDEEPVEVEVLVDADQAGFAVGAAGESAVSERRPGGAVVLRLRVTNRAALRSFVLGWLDHAEILGPPSERLALVDWVRRGMAVEGR
jgi:predicted DNA-binding transcriptional regulator YafY